MSTCAQTLNPVLLFWLLMDCSPSGSSVCGTSQVRVGCYSLLQGIFPTQGSNLGLLCLLYWQEGSLPLASSGTSYKYNHAAFVPLTLASFNEHKILNFHVCCHLLQDLLPFLSLNNIPLYANTVSLSNLPWTDA